MNTSILNSFLMNCDRHLRTKTRKICLFIDNCPGHNLNFEPTNIEVIFTPPNKTSKLQHLDAGIIRSFKAYFNSCKINDTYLKIEKNMSVQQSFKEINLRDVIVYTTMAWKSIKQETIRNCFCHCGFGLSKTLRVTEDKDLREEYDQFIKENKIFDSISFEAYASEDFNKGNILFTEEKNGESAETEDDENIDQEQKTTQKISEPLVEKKIIGMTECFEKLKLVNDFITNEKFSVNQRN